MLEWVNSHGLEAIAIYVLFLLVAGTVPPLPDNSGFMVKWGYFFLKALSFNARGIGNALGIKVPELQLANLPVVGTKKEVSPKE